MSPCDSSFIDVDDDGVCSPGDVPIAALLKPLASGGTFVFDSRMPLTDAGGAVVYTPPADGHPVGVVFGGRIVLGAEADFEVTVTGDVHVNGRMYSNDASFFSVRTCRNLTFERRSLVQTQGIYNTEQVLFIAEASLCPDTTTPARLELARSARINTANDFVLIGDELQVDEHVLLQAFEDLVLEAIGTLELNSGALTFGKSVRVKGAIDNQLYVDNCGATTTADHLNVKIGTMSWGNGDMYSLCNHVLADGTPYNVNVGVPQRLTLTKSTLWSTNGASIVMNPNSTDGTYACDAITLVKTKVKPYLQSFEFLPAPRLDPAGPCNAS